MFDKSKISSNWKKRKRIKPNFKRIHTVAFRLFSNIKSIQIQVSTIQFASNSKKHRCLSTANSTFHSRDELGFIQSGRNSARKSLSSSPLFLLLRSIERFKNRGIKEKKVDPLSTNRFNVWKMPFEGKLVGRKDSLCNRENAIFKCIATIPKDDRSTIPAKRSSWNARDKGAPGLDSVAQVSFICGCVFNEIHKIREIFRMNGVERII